MADWAAQKRDFDDLPGVGGDLAGKIKEVLERGSCDQLDRLRGQFPRGITALLQIPGLGPKRVHALYHELGVQSPAQILSAAREGRIRGIHGFGETSEKRIAEAVAGYLQRSARWPIARIAADVEALLEYLRATPGVSEAVAAGSYRRRRDTVGDIDLMANALKVTGLRTKREAVELGLKTLIKLKQQEKIRQFRGKLPWQGDLDELRSDN